MKSPEPAISVRPMRQEDIPFGLKLSRAAGWNQTEADWNMLFQHGAAGSQVAYYDGVLAGTVTLVSYQDRFRWVGMMLVADEFQRRGIGRALLTTALERLKDSETAFLDATPAGKRLYDSLGFKEVYGLARCLRRHGPTPVRTEIPVKPVSNKILLDLYKYDIPTFGAERSPILSALYQRAPHLAFYSGENGAVSGYCLGRTGRQFTQIGPIIADRLEIAQALLLTALQNCAQEEVIVDTPLHQSGWNQFLSDIGFKIQRPFTRMKIGEFELPEDHALQLAIAGPEMG